MRDRVTKTNNLGVVLKGLIDSLFVVSCRSKNGIGLHAKKQRHVNIKIINAIVARLQLLI